MTSERELLLKKGGRSRLLPVAALGIVVGGLAGCEVGGALIKVGLADAPPAPPEVLDVVCDPSVGSTCTVEKLGDTLMVIFGRAAARPGSVVRLWMLGSEVEATDVKAEVSSPPLTGRTARARAAEAARWQAHDRELFLARVSSIINATRRPTSSPLAEAITKVALADGHGLPRKIVLVSDGREMSVADFECGPLPSDASWATRLKKLGLLAPDSLDGIDIAFTYSTMPAIERCSVSLKRELRIRELWKNALTGAGASEVRMLSGPVTWEERVAVRATGDGK